MLYIFLVCNVDITCSNSGIIYNYLATNLHITPLDPQQSRQKTLSSVHSIVTLNKLS